MSLVHCFAVGVFFGAQNPLTALAGSKASKVLESMFSVWAPLPELCMLALQTALPAHAHVDRHVLGFYVVRNEKVPVSALMKAISAQGGCMISGIRFLSV